MAHPFASSRAHSASRKRAGVLMKAAGGKAHSDAAADKKMIAAAVSAHAKKEHGVHGLKRGGRLEKYARGGRAKSKGKHHTQVNVVVAPSGPHPAAGALPGGPPVAIPPRPPLGGAAPVPPGLPPGGPMGGPPGMPPGMPPRPGMKSGGRIKHKGSVLTGVGRKEIAAIQKKEKK